MGVLVSRTKDSMISDLGEDSPTNKEHEMLLPYGLGHLGSEITGTDCQHTQQGSRVQGASCHGCYDMPQVFLDFIAQRVEGNSLLQAAINTGHLDVLQFLSVDRGANMKALLDECTQTLHIVSQKWISHEGVFDLEPQRLGESTSQGSYGSALHSMVSNDKEALGYTAHNWLHCQCMVGLWAAQGVDVDAQTRYEHILKAAKWKNTHVLSAPSNQDTGCSGPKVILDHEVDVNIQRCNEDALPVVQLCEEESHKSPQLLQHGRDLNAHGGKYQDPLEVAAYKREAVIVQSLLEGRADVNAQAEEHLQSTVNQRDMAILQLQLQNEAGVDAQGAQYDNALQRLCPDIVNLLLNQANVTRSGREFGNVLCAVASRHYSEIIQLLLKQVMYESGQKPVTDTNCEEVEQLVLNGREDINTQESNLGHASETSIYSQVMSEKSLQMMSEDGEPVSMQERCGDLLQTALSFQESSHKTLLLLLEQRGDVNALGRYKKALQMAACQNIHALSSILKCKLDMTHEGMFACISCMPAEILGKIFLMYVEMCSCESPEWVGISHVCHWWRVVALEYSKLWSTVYIQERQIEWQSHMLLRSRMAPLTLNIKQVQTVDAAKRVAGIITEHHCRIETLSLEMDCHSDELLSSIVDLSAPILTSFIMSSKNSDYIIPTLFQDHAPHLHVVNLTGIALNWQSPMFGFLTELKLKNIPVNARPTLEELLSVLQRCKGLEALELTEVQTVQMGEQLQAESCKPVELPYLQSLTFNDFVSSCASLMNHLSLPIEAKVTLACWSWIPSFTEILAVATKYSKGLDMLEIIECSSYEIAFQGWRKLPNGCRASRYSSPALFIGFTWTPQVFSQSAQVIGDLSCALELNELRYLHIWYVELPCHWWLAFCQRAEKMLIVEIVGESAKGLIDALLNTSLEASQPQELPLSQLQKLSLNNVDFNHFGFCDKLYKCLHARKAFNKILQCLQVIDTVGMNPSRKKQLLEVVTAVEWDHVEKDHYIAKHFRHPGSL